MKRLLACSSLLFYLLACPLTAAAERPSDHDMMQMLKLSGSVEVLLPMMDQLVESIKVNIRKESPNLPEGALQAISDELQAGTARMLKKMLASQMDYYAERLTKQEVDELIAIYSSPVWQKQVGIGKEYIQDDFPTVMQVMVPEMSQDLMQRVYNRLVADGYIQDTGAAS